MNGASSPSVPWCVGARGFVCPISSCSYRNAARALGIVSLLVVVILAEIAQLLHRFGVLRF